MALARAVSFYDWLTVYDFLRLAVRHTTYLVMACM